MYKLKSSHSVRFTYKDLVIMSAVIYKHIKISQKEGSQFYVASDLSYGCAIYSSSSSCELLKHKHITFTSGVLTLSRRG